MKQLIMGLLMAWVLGGCYSFSSVQRTPMGDRRVNEFGNPVYRHVDEHVDSLPAEERCHNYTGVSPSPWAQINCAGLTASGGQQFGMGYAPGMTPFGSPYGMPYGSMGFAPPSAYPVH